MQALLDANFISYRTLSKTRAVPDRNAPHAWIERQLREIMRTEKCEIDLDNVEHSSPTDSLHCRCVRDRCSGLSLLTDDIFIRNSIWWIYNYPCGRNYRNTRLLLSLRHVTFCLAERELSGWLVAWCVDKVTHFIAKLCDGYWSTKSYVQYTT